MIRFARCSFSALAESHSNSSLEGFVTLNNCRAGDSEAVLERDGEAMRVAAAHKPDDPQELRRIEAKGGTVIVDQRRIKSPTLARGALNMSRSLGDPAWKQPRRLVSCEPSVMHLNLRFCACSSHLLPSNCLHPTKYVSRIPTFNGGTAKST